MYRLIHPGRQLQWQGRNQSSLLLQQSHQSTRHCRHVSSFHEKTQYTLVALTPRLLTDGTNEQVKNNNMEDHNTQVNGERPKGISTTSCSGGPEYTSLPRNDLPLKFSWLSSVPPGKSLVDDKLGHDSFLPRPFQFIAHHLPYTFHSELPELLAQSLYKP